MFASWLASGPFLFLALLLCSPALRAAAAEPGEFEYQVKAAFVVKFIGYVEWPAQVMAAPDQPFRIGVAGQDALVDELRRTAAGITAAGRPIEVRRLARGDEAAGVQLLFVARASSGQLAPLLAAVRERPVLTVTETDPAEAGGMINFVVVDDKVRFDVALPAAEQSGLRISARLLAVARRVVMGR